MVEWGLRTPKLDRAEVGDDAVELDEFPAAVVCAHCGRGDCAGQCEDHDLASQVFAIVPWERPGSGWIRRLWSTARLATLKHETFFGSLPGGDYGSALRFAATAELTTVAVHALLLAGVASAIFPDLARAVVADSALQVWLLRGSILGLPLLAAVMVALHLIHGVGLDFGARHRAGRSRHGFRFGCYACGWDLLSLPIGVVVTALTDGPRDALRAIALGLTAPRRAGAAYLRGVHRLEGPALQRALLLGSIAPAGALLTVLLLAAAGTLAAVLLGVH
ncbi:MAG: hypothetical protein JW751_14720 [Polyangiaceae bacterium]|nr:hypothetical protein [Polyangiaceae bacterium]